MGRVHKGRTGIRRGGREGSLPKEMAPPPPKGTIKITAGNISKIINGKKVTLHYGRDPFSGELRALLSVGQNKKRVPEKVAEIFREWERLFDQRLATAGEENKRLTKEMNKKEREILKMLKKNVLK